MKVFYFYFSSGCEIIWILGASIFISTSSYFLKLFTLMFLLECVWVGGLTDLLSSLWTWVSLEGGKYYSWCCFFSRGLMKFGGMGPFPKKWSVCVRLGIGNPDTSILNFLMGLGAFCYVTCSYFIDSILDSSPSSELLRLKYSWEAETSVLVCPAEWEGKSAWVNLSELYNFNIYLSWLWLALLLEVDVSRWGLLLFDALYWFFIFSPYNNRKLCILPSAILNYSIKNINVF